MKIRRVYAVDDLPTARRAMEAARGHGADAEDVALIARSDIELEELPDHHIHKEAGGDFYPAALRGVVGGGATGVLAGLVAIAIPPLGITLAGAAGIAAAGALVGGWTGALTGSAVPDPVRRKFEDEIAAGRILVVVDIAEDAANGLDPAVIATGARALPFDTPKALT